MKIHNYKQFIRESNELSSHYLPTYEDCVEIASKFEFIQNENI